MSTAADDESLSNPGSLTIISANDSEAAGDDDTEPSSFNWRVYQNRSRSTLADAVALSLGRSPAKINTLIGKEKPLRKAFKTRLKTAMLETLGNGRLELVNKGSSPDGSDWVVEIDSFVALAVELGWGSLTRQFMQLGKRARTKTGPNQGAKPNGVLDTPWLGRGHEQQQSATRVAEHQNSKQPDGQVSVDLNSSEAISGEVTITLPYMTKMLEAVFQVMREQAPAYQSDRPQKQIIVAHEIDRALGNFRENREKASRTGEVLATVIRPDNLKDADSRANRRKL